MQEIMLIEDDADISMLLCEYLLNYGFEVKAFDKPKEALLHLQENKERYALLVLDLMLPQMDGFDVCKRVREISNIPIIISSARSEMSDKILGFDFGADDYLAKPYEPRELVLRINSILRRTTKRSKVIGDFEIDEAKLEIKVDGLLLDLTKVEYDILQLFLLNSDKVLSRESIANAVNSIEYNSKDRTIDMHISNLRQKLGDDPKDPRYIKSVWGIGYKFIG
ncbi:MAG: response regulator transcription factor [Epsilonproteobacteria bacterium]|nr:response regulator transcription factor [Campylobacterota bacterium]OIO15661.1 MAG: DNA-binding response regulator [Helicobacteraceae bacterium CG1_02_36_14]PIP11397.1 MAG: DNA-binding response regulator [Sulfurimonas sp. CG23_combo_of_CG06-09_8_20_14_all_36_33]PIS23799.1 MAG: DNA-binding response regulator [Sulfurimonas sp. CG08_land_8_20_14_0_20_36_33]PIU34775.1 MAG: DNA-binding response regulator [Sulfurimonas sp. CG07_land_8_20_14_0_80_36_56]PIV05822.1 MAG: DNA-binding response regulato